MNLRLFCFVLATFCALVVSGQDPVWKSVSITPGVSVSMPGPTTTLDSTQVQAINAQLNGYFFQLKYLKIKYEVKNGDQLIQAYDGFLKGYIPAAVKMYTNTVSDTSLKGTMGEWIHSRYSKDRYFEMYTYLVLVNSHFYMITLAADHPTNANDTILRKYFASLEFPVQPIKEYSGDFPLQAKSYRNGQRIGVFIRAEFPYVLGAGIVALILVLGYRKIRKRSISHLQGKQ